MIFAIDPGPERSAYVLLGGDGVPIEFEILDNRNLGRLERMSRSCRGSHDLVIESVESYGMPVGKEVFETCYWIGRFDANCTATLIPRRDIKLHLCGSPRAKDSHIRQALIDRFGPGKAKAIGLKATPGPLYGFKSHLWSALALAVTHYDKKAGVKK